MCGPVKVKLPLSVTLNAKEEVAQVRDICI